MNRREIERATTASLHARQDALGREIDTRAPGPWPLDNTGIDADVVALAHEFDLIEDELEARKSDADEPVDYDQHDRNAAESERLDNLRRER